MLRHPLISGYNPNMPRHWEWLLIVVLVWSVTAWGSDQQQMVLSLPCVQSQNGSPGCKPSEADVKKAKSVFAKGVKLQKAHHLDEAYRQFDAAARLVPHNLDYVTALAMAREQLAYDHLQRGNENLMGGKEIEAQAEFRSALNLDPENEFAQQRLSDSLTEWAPKGVGQIAVVKDSGELHALPQDMRADFHFSGDSKALLTQVAAAFGLTVEFDESVVSRRVRFEIGNVDFYSAMRAGCAVTGTFWTPLAEKQILVARDTAELHRQYDHMALRVFSVPYFTQQQDLNQLVSVLRTVFDVRFAALQISKGTLEVRAAAKMLDAITEVIENLGSSHPQVMLDMEVYQIDHQLTRNLGLQIPNNFTLFNIPAGALSALTALGGGQDIQSLINQLISGGGINQANSQGIGALLAQLQGQQNSIFSQPLATFGGGLTLMGLSLGTLGAQLSLNESWVKSLDHATFRTAQGSDASLRMGTRYPILNGSFAPVFNSPAISQVLQNQSFQAPFPSFSYEDLGLTVKAKPVVNASQDVGLTLEIQLRTLSGQSLNGVPVISNREYKGGITLMNGEPAVVAGAINESETKSLTGIPGLGQIPLLNRLTSSNSKMSQEDELLVVITPHVVNYNRRQSSEVWLPPM